MDRTIIEKIVGEAIAAHNGVVAVPVFNPEDLIRRIGEAYDEEAMRGAQAGLATAIEAKDSMLVLTPLHPNPKPAPEVSVVLCVRTRPMDAPPTAVQEFREAFPHNLIRLVYVNPKTAQELDDMTDWPNVAAVYLQEQPLPAIVLKKKRIPCVVMDQGGLRRLLGIIPDLSEFSGLTTPLS